MLTIAVGLYTIVALIGIYLLVRLFSRTPPKYMIGIIHGAIGLGGIGLLIIYISFKQGDTPYLSILFFLVAFLIGGGMFITRLNGKMFPKWVALLHIAIAATGLYFLVSFWIN